MSHDGVAHRITRVVGADPSEPDPPQRRAAEEPVGQDRRPGRPAAGGAVAAELEHPSHLKDALQAEHTCIERLADLITAVREERGW